jgi:hypothetical protein
MIKVMGAIKPCQSPNQNPGTLPFEDVAVCVAVQATMSNKNVLMMISLKKFFCMMPPLVKNQVLLLECFSQHGIDHQIVELVCFLKNHVVPRVFKVIKVFKGCL